MLPESSMMYEKVTGLLGRGGVIMYAKVTGLLGRGGVMMYANAWCLQIILTIN